MAKRRLPKDFDVTAPPKVVTDPDRADRDEAGIATDPAYPKHLAKPDLVGEGGHHNREIQIAQNAGDEKRLKAQGYMSHQDADAAERKAAGVSAPKAAKPKAARKPANRPPQAPAADVVQ